MPTSTHGLGVWLNLENLASRAKLPTALRGVNPEVPDEWSCWARGLSCRVLALADEQVATLGLKLPPPT